MLTAFRYPNLGEETNGPKTGQNIATVPGLELHATQFPVST